MSAGMGTTTSRKVIDGACQVVSTNRWWSTELEATADLAESLPPREMTISLHGQTTSPVTIGVRSVYMVPSLHGEHYQTRGLAYFHLGVSHTSIT